MPRLLRPFGPWLLLLGLMACRPAIEELIVCESHDECLPGYRCGDSGLCEKGEPGPSCEQGFEWDGSDCVDIDECAHDNGGCHAQATCINTEGAFRCECPEDLEGDGFSCDPYLPGSPEGLEAEVEADAVTLTWQASARTDGYLILRRFKGTGEFGSLVDHPVSGTTFVDEATLPGVRYEYVVRAINDRGNGRDTEPLEVLTLPSSPVDFEAWAEDGDGVYLVWAAPMVEGPGLPRRAQEIDTFVIFRQVNEGSWREVARSANLDHFEVPPGGQISYRLASANASGTGAWSEPQTVDTPDVVPATPQVGWTRTGPLELTLSWTEDEGADSFEVVYGLTEGPPWDATLDTLSDSSVVVENLPWGLPLHFGVRGLNHVGAGAFGKVEATIEPDLVPDTPVVDDAPTAITLSWEPLAHAAAYVIESSEEGEWIEVDRVETSHWEAAGHLRGYRHEYRIRALNAINVSSPPSAGVEVWTAPAAPADLSGNFTGAIELSWSAVPGADGYRILRATGSEGNYVQVGETTSLTFIDTEFDAGVTYRYVVRSFNVRGESFNSTSVAMSSGLPAPLDLVAQGGQRSITLRWSAVDGAVRYEIERSGMENGGFEPLVSVSSGTTHQDEGLATGGRYYYVVYAVDGEGTPGTGSPVVSAFTAPPPPTNFRAVGGDRNVQLRWDAAPGEPAYTVDRLVAGNWVEVGTTTATQLEDTGLLDGIAYRYRINARNDAGVQEGHAPETTALTYPPAPAGLEVESGIHRLHLSWSASRSATTYRVFRASSATGPFQQIAQLSGTAFEDSPLPANTAAHYRVRAFNASGPSHDSEVASALTHLSSPRDLWVLDTTTGKVSLRWTAVEGAEAYRLYRRHNNKMTEEDIEEPEFLDSDVEPGETYFYSVAAIGRQGIGPRGREAVATVGFDVDLLVTDLQGGTVYALAPHPKWSAVEVVRKLTRETRRPWPSSVVLDELHGELIVGTHDGTIVGLQWPLDERRTVNWTIQSPFNELYLAHDPYKDEIYVATPAEPAVFVIRPGRPNPEPHRMISLGAIGAPTGLAFDPVTRTLVVALEWGLAFFDDEASEGSEPLRFIAGEVTGLKDVVDVTVDGDGLVLAADRSEKRILAFDSRAKGDVPPAWKTDRLEFTPLAVGASQKGDQMLVVASDEELHVQQGKDWHVIAGPRTLLGVPLSVAVGSDRIVTADHATGLVQSFDLKASGNAAPLEVAPFVTEDRLPTSPMAITHLPERGEIAVVDAGGNAVRIFEARDTGNVSPKRSIELGVRGTQVTNTYAGPHELLAVGTVGGTVADGVYFLPPEVKNLGGAVFSIQEVSPIALAFDEENDELLVLTSKSTVQGYAMRRLLRYGSTNESDWTVNVDKYTRSLAVGPQGLLLLLPQSLEIIARDGSFVDRFDLVHSDGRHLAADGRHAYVTLKESILYVDLQQRSIMELSLPDRPVELFGIAVQRRAPAETPKY